MNRNKINSKLFIFATLILTFFISLIGISFSLVSQSISESTADFSGFKTLAISDSQKAVSDSHADNFNLIDYVPGQTTEMYILVNFVNFENGNSFTEQEKSNIQNYFNDNTENNEIFSVHEYFYGQSQGRLSVWALFMDYTAPSTMNQTYFSSSDATMAYNREVLVFNYALNENRQDFVYDGKTIKDFTCRINYFAGNATNSESNFWPHNWVQYSQDYTSMTSSGLILLTQNVSNQDFDTYIGVICHELTHLTGICDYYVHDSSFFPVGEWDIMSNTNYDHPQTMSPYFRKIVGWFDESYYYDNEQTQIEYISSSGTYKIYDSSNTDKTKTLAYKFGIRNGDKTEFFMIEFKNKNYTLTPTDYYTVGTRLLIYRINENITKGNNESTNANDCNMYVFRSSSTDNKQSLATCGVIDSLHSISGVPTSYGSTSDSALYKITYSNGDNSKIVVSDLDYDALNHAMTFKIDFPTDIYSACGHLYLNDEAYSGAKVLVNGVESGVTTSNDGYYFVTGLNKNDIISFKDSKSEISKSITITKDWTQDTYAYSKADLTFNVKFDLLPLKNVKIFVNGVEKGTTNLLGNATIENVELKSIISFSLTNYDFDPSSITFSDIETTSYSIIASGAKRDLTVNFVVNDVAILDVAVYEYDALTGIKGELKCLSSVDGTAVIKDAIIGESYIFEKSSFTFNEQYITFVNEDIIEFNILGTYTASYEFYNLLLLIKDFDNQITLTDEEDDFEFNIIKSEENTIEFDYFYEYGLWYFIVEENDILQISKSGYKPLDLTITTSLLESRDSKTIELYKYQTLTYTLSDIYENRLSGVQLSINGNDTVVATSNENGLLVYNKFITGDILYFKSSVLDEYSLIFEAKTSSELQNITMQYAIIPVEIKLYSYYGELLNSDLSVVVLANNKVVEYTYDIDTKTLLIQQARFLDTIEVQKPGYKIDSLNLAIDLAKDGTIAQDLTALKYLSISGRLLYKNGEDLELSYSVYYDNEYVDTLNADRTFNLVNVLEGTEIKFLSNGYQSAPYIVTQNQDNLELYVTFTATKTNHIILFIILALLLALLLVNIGNPRRVTKR